MSIVGCSSTCSVQWDSYVPLTSMDERTWSTKGQAPLAAALRSGAFGVQIAFYCRKAITFHNHSPALSAVKARMLTLRGCIAVCPVTFGPKWTSLGFGRGCG